MITLCIAMSQLTIQMDHARRVGVTADQAQAVIDRAPARNREMAKAVAWYVYEANPDSGISSRQLAAEVRAACDAQHESMRNSK